MRRRHHLLPLTKYEREKYDRLLKATAHVAPIVHWPSDRACLKYWDTLRIIREYNRRNALLAVARDAIVRLAGDRYGRRYLGPGNR